MLPKHVWDNITQENYLCIFMSEHTDILSQENRLFQICQVACFLTGYNTTKQSWLSLFNVISGVHLRLVGQQWTGADFKWKQGAMSYILSVKWLSGCSEVGHYEIYQKYVQVTPSYSNILLTNDLTNICSKISKIRLILWMVYKCNVKGLEEVERLVRNKCTLDRWPRSPVMNHCSRPEQ